VKARFIVLVFLSFLSLKLCAAVPDIGDNSLFKCVATADEIDESFCYGEIVWVTNKKGLSKNDMPLGFFKAKKIARNTIKYFKKKRNRARRNNDTELFNFYESKRLNAIVSKRELSDCYNDYYESCDDSGDDSADFPSAMEACNLISDPRNYGDIPRSMKKNIKAIVNGVVCSNTTAANSPVVLVLNRNNVRCTGTYVGPTTVLTAAHCMDGVNCANISVRNSSGSQRIYAAECLSHPLYEQVAEAQAHDLAILNLQDSFSGITPAKVAQEQGVVAEQCVLTGYGQSENNDSFLRATFNRVSSRTEEVISTLYTQGDINQGTTCYGDSGGPLFVFQDGEWKTIGTLSDGSANDCALPNTSPSYDYSNWANLSSEANQSFIRDNTSGVLD
jgi:V8-like Glu-specific endopeptidase